MYNLGFKESAHSKLKKATKRDVRKYEIVNKKIDQILENPYQFKPLRAPMQNFRRVHIDKSFVLIYSIDEPNKKVIIEDYDHHDNIYWHY